MSGRRGLSLSGVRGVERLIGINRSVRSLRLRTIETLIERETDRESYGLDRS